MGNETIVIMVLGVCKFINLLYGACILKQGNCDNCIPKQGNYDNCCMCVTGRHEVTLNPEGGGLGKLLLIKSFSRYTFIT